VWVYERTNGSLLVAILMHMSLTANTVFILNPVATGMALVTWTLVWAAALWIVVGVLAIASHGHLSRQSPLRRRVA